VLAICVAVALSVSSAYAVRGAGAPGGARCALASAHRASMASYRMIDLKEEINRRRGGEDNRTTIKCNRERRRDIEGHNLERDFELHALAGARQATHAPLPLASPEFQGGGCMALAPHLCMVVWPPKFRPHLPEKYDGTVNLAEFLRIYSTSILVAGGMRLSWPITSS
jgi:hypothetical protein